MININGFIYPELILADLQAATKEEALKIMLKRVYEIYPDFSKENPFEMVYHELISREKLQTTGLGQKIAFPHARIKNWPQFVIVLAVCKNGLDFNSLDKQPVNFICLMISAAEEPYIILQAMAAIIRLLHDTKHIDTLFAGLNASQIHAEFKKYDISATKIICSRDIMRPIKVQVSHEATIEEVSRTMHLSHLDVLPVVAENNKFCGQISCSNIFIYGIPEFFKHLNTVSFVRHIDPFEKYFKIKKSLKAKDLLDKECTTISQDASLLEIVFEISIKNKPKLFVIDNGNLVGEIDRFSIIDKILFF